MNILCCAVLCNGWEINGWKIINGQNVVYRWTIGYSYCMK